MAKAPRDSLFDDIIELAANGLIADETERERYALLQAAAVIWSTAANEMRRFEWSSEEIAKACVNSATVILNEIKRREPKDEAPDI